MISLLFVRVTATRNHQSELCEKDDGFIEFEGKDLLKYMVRNFVGTLVYVEKNKYAASHVATILEARNRKIVGPTASPKSLCLIKT